ncbi:hypothetical protein [Clostridium ljungdahlii]|uniref:hypothetical protein n=1 Tax=Clostridium ljungdahlii TaxID=1538 RepID=UPI00386D5BDA
MYCSGFNRVIIKVKSSNYIALQLYTNMGFRIESEKYNWTLDKKVSINNYGNFFIIVYFITFWYPSIAALR